MASSREPKKSYKISGGSITDVEETIIITQDAKDPPYGINSQKTHESEETPMRRAAARRTRPSLNVHNLNQNSTLHSQRNDTDKDAISRSKNCRTIMNPRNRSLADHVVNVVDSPTRETTVPQEQIKQLERDQKSSEKQFLRRSRRQNEAKSPTNEQSPNFNRCTVQSDRRKRQGSIRPKNGVVTRQSAKLARQSFQAEPIDIDDDDIPFTTKQNSQLDRSEGETDGGNEQKADKSNVSTISLEEKECKKEAQELATLDAPYTGPVHLIFEYPPGKRGKIRVTAEERGRLVQKKYLNDSLIDFYIKYLETELLRRPGNDIGTTKFFSSFFFGRLCRTKPIDYDGVKGWTKDVNLFETHFVFVPICESYHWSLIIVANLCNLTKVMEADNKTIVSEKERPRIVYLDSLDPKRGVEFAETIRHYLIEEWLTRNQISSSDVEMRRNISLKMKKLITSNRPIVPIQTNEYDCGLYLLNSLEMFLNNTDGLMQRLLHGEKDVQDIYSHIDVQIHRKAITHLMDLMEEEWNRHQNPKNLAKQDIDVQQEASVYQKPSSPVPSAPQPEEEEEEEEKQLSKSFVKLKNVSTGMNVQLENSASANTEDQQVCMVHDENTHDVDRKDGRKGKLDESSSMALQNPKVNYHDLTNSEAKDVDEEASTAKEVVHTVIEDEKHQVPTIIEADSNSQMCINRPVQSRCNVSKPTQGACVNWANNMSLNSDNKNRRKQSLGLSRRNISVQHAIQDRSDSESVEEDLHADNYSTRNRGIKRTRGVRDLGEKTTESSGCKCEVSGFGGNCPDCKPKTFSKYEQILDSGRSAVQSTWDASSERYRQSMVTNLRSRPVENLGTGGGLRIQDHRGHHRVESPPCSNSDDDLRMVEGNQP